MRERERERERNRDGGEKKQRRKGRNICYAPMIPALS
jgi:hypothetical protein